VGSDAVTEKDLWRDNFLSRFSPPVQEKLLALSEPFHFTAGQTIFDEGAPSLYLYVVKTGRVAIEAHIRAWGSRLITTLGPGELFSWSALIEPRIETASARALEDTEVVRVKGGALMDACREDAQFGFQLYRTLAEVITDRLVSTRHQLLGGHHEPEEARSSR